jgi:hypothetical protein
VGGAGGSANHPTSVQRPFEEEKWDRDSLSISPVRHNAGNGMLEYGASSNYSAINNGDNRMKKIDINFEKKQTN